MDSIVLHPHEMAALGSGLQVWRPVVPSTGLGWRIFQFHDRQKDCIRWVRRDTVHSDPAWDTDVVCPLGAVGDQFHVLEEWRFCGTVMDRLGRTHSIQDGVFQYKVDDSRRTIERPWNDIEQYMKTVEGDAWRAAGTMPEWVSRRMLEVVSIRAARVGDVTGYDLAAMGFTRLGDLFKTWDALYPENPWSSDPWCWVAAVREHNV